MYVVKPVNQESGTARQFNAVIIIEIAKRTSDKDTEDDQPV